MPRVTQNIKLLFILEEKFVGKVYLVRFCAFCTGRCTSIFPVLKYGVVVKLDACREDSWRIRLGTWVYPIVWVRLFGVSFSIFRF